MIMIVIDIVNIVNDIDNVTLIFVRNDCSAYSRQTCIIRSVDATA